MLCALVMCTVRGHQLAWSALQEPGVTQVVGLSSGAQYTVHGTRGSNTGPLLAVSHSPCSLETVRMLECIHTTALLVCCQGYLREPVILCGGCERNRELRLRVARGLIYLV